MINICLKIAGGLKIDEPGADLPVALALISAAKDKPVPKDCMVIGEIGLSGEIRMVSQIEARLKEAQKLGFTKAIVQEGIFNIKQFKPEKYKIKIYPVKHIRDVARLMSNNVN